MEEAVAGAEEQRNELKEDCANIEEKLTKEENKLSTMEKEFEKEESLHEKSLKDIKEHLATLIEFVFHFILLLSLSTFLSLPMFSNSFRKPLNFFCNSSLTYALERMSELAC